MSEERFYAKGRDVLDTQRPDRYCGFLYRDTAEHVAERFNEDPAMAEGFAWVYFEDDEIVVEPGWVDDDYDDWCWEDEDEDEVDMPKLHSLFERPTVFDEGV